MSITQPLMYLLFFYAFILPLSCSHIVPLLSFLVWPFFTHSLLSPFFTSSPPVSFLVNIFFCKITFKRSNLQGAVHSFSRHQFDINTQIPLVTQTIERFSRVKYSYALTERNPAGGKMNVFIRLWKAVISRSSLWTMSNSLFGEFSCRCSSVRLLWPWAFNAQKYSEALFTRQQFQPKNRKLLLHFDCNLFDWKAFWLHSFENGTVSVVV